MQLIVWVAGEISDCPAGSRVAVWDGPATPRRTISLPEYMRKNLARIRAEHANWAYEMGKLKTNGGEFAALLECGEPLSMWWTSLLYERHPKLSPRLYTIYRLRALEMLLAEEGYDSLALVGGDKQLEQVLAGLCAAMGLSFHARQGRKTRPECSLLRRVYNFLPAPLRAGLRYIHWLCVIKRRLPYVSKSPWPDRHNRAAATIITYYPNIDLGAAASGRFVSRYWEDLHASLCRTGAPALAIHWLFIRFPSPQLDLKDCIVLRDKFVQSGEDGDSFDYLEEFISPGDQLGALGRWLRLCMASLALERSARENSCFRGSRLNFWPYIKDQWAESFRGWRCLERAMQLRGFKRYCRRAGQQEWILYPLENCPWERMATDSARRAGICKRIYGVQHSIIRPADFRYFDSPQTFSDQQCSCFQPDVIGGNGQSAIEQWLAAGVPPGRLKKLEALRYLYLVAKERAGDTPSPIPPGPGAPPAAGWQQTLLVLTGFFRDETAAHLELLRQALEAGVLDGWQIVIKPHPCLSVQPWLDNLASDPAGKISVSAEPLSLLLRPGAHVWASNSTTATLEAMLLGLPVMVMLPYGDFDLCPVQDVPGLLRTGCIEDVKNGLLASSPPALPDGFLDLDPGLHAWKDLLGLNHCTKQAINIA